MEKMQLAIWISFLLTEGLCSNVTALGCKGDTCYWVVAGPVRWNQAGNLCNSFNRSRLVTIEDADTNIFLWTKTHQLGVTPWIGVTYVTFRWKWIDGTLYTGSHNIQGMAISGCKHCALARLSTINSEVNITARDCHDMLEQRPFICSKKGVNPTPSSITVHTISVTWIDARQQCRNEGLDLAVFSGPTFESVVAHIRTQTSLVEFWIGLYKGKWISISTGQELSFLRTTSCASHLFLNSDGYWYRSTLVYPSLCSLGGSLPTSPLVPFPSPSSKENLPDATESTAMGGSIPTSTLVPFPSRGSKENQQDAIESTAMEFDIIHKAIIPLACILGTCVIAIVIGCLVRRKITASRIENEVTRRIESIDMSEANNKEKASGYDKLGAKSLQNEDTYETLDENAHPYLEIE